MSDQIELDFGLVYTKPTRFRKPLRVTASAKLQKSISANHYFDEDLAVILLNGIKTGESTVNDLAPLIQPIIVGVVNRRAYCEDRETREDLVGDVWVGILRYGLLERWEPGYSRAFSYLTGIAQNTLYYVLGDRNKARANVGAPASHADIEDCEQIGVEDAADPETLAAGLSGRFSEFSTALDDMLQ